MTEKELLEVIRDLKEKIRNLEDKISEIKQWQRSKEYEKMMEEQGRYK